MNAMHWEANWIAFYIMAYTQGSTYLVPTPQFGPLEHYDELSVKSYILHHLEDGPAFASDHQPMMSFFD